MEQYNLSIILVVGANSDFGAIVISDKITCRIDDGGHVQVQTKISEAN